MKNFNLDAIDQFLRSCRSKGMSKETTRAYRSDLRQLHSGIGDQSSDSEFEEAVADWITDNRVLWKPRTTLRKMTAARSCAKFLGCAEILVDYRAPKPDRLVAHPLPDGMADVRKMLASCRTGREAALVALCGLLGLRVAEALTVRVMDFDFADRTLTVRGGKGDKDRTIPVHDDAWSPIFRGIDDQPNNYLPLVCTGNRNARRLLTEIGARCGVKVASHDLRSTVLTEMYRASKDLRATQEFAGHSSSATTEAYTGIRMKDMRDAIGAI